ncbi:hypothetical protein [Solimonas soli]|uniref:hypothetical protein n=1 Tax=Solimonas soli TaxID=413479 RepID=UPI00048423AC|nr:hypothetical protein [Solimonas soli]
MPLVLLALLLVAPHLAAAAEPPAPAASAPPPAEAPEAVFPRLMTVQEAAQTPEQKAEEARHAQSLALGERLLQTAQSLRNMGVLTLSALLGLIGSGLVGALIALVVSRLRERRGGGSGYGSG